MTAYPLITFRTGFRIKDITVIVTVQDNSSKNVSIFVYNKEYEIYIPVSTMIMRNANKTVTYELIFSVPWSTTRGNATVNVIIDKHSFKRIFLFHRHSTAYYATLAMLMLLSSLTLFVYIVHRVRVKNRSTVVYTNDIE